MVKSKHQEEQSDRKPISYCFNRDCQQPKNSDNSNRCISCGSSLLLKNRYRAVKLIGYGGFGRTFQGIDESQVSKPYCAIKQFWLQSGNPSREKAAELFSQEAQRLEVLGTHPNIPALQDYFVEAKDQYLIQEFISGRNLSQELREEGAWTEDKVRNLLLNLLPLMQFFHSQQIIHRDIKPENIIRRQGDGELFLVDFGAAKVVTETSLGKTGTIIGSAAYTAPEQLQGKAVFASDFYSLGVTCIHLLTQVHPFNLFDSGEYLWNWRDYLTQPVSERLKKIIDKMLEGAVNKRYQSAEEILKDLREKPIKPKNTAKKLLGASAVAVLVLLGMRALMSPVIRQVSTTIEQEPSRQYSSLPQVNSELGGLYGYSKGEQVQTFPLEHTTVTAKIAGNLSRVEVKQTFSNPNNKPLEAIYKFPLPEDAAVDDMEIRIGERVIRGLIKKREEAQKIYQEAKREGKTAGLLEQQRDNIFTQSLANIQPGEKIDVVIRYTNTLQFIGSNYEFVFPMVVAPRYESGTPTGKRFNPFEAPAWASGLPETRSGRDIDVNIEIDAGVTISELQSFSHPIKIQKNRSITRVSLAKRDVIANQDLILRYQVMGAKTQATVLTQRNQQGGHFATYLIPAVNYKPEQIVPKDVIFLIDTSGSQSGAAIEQSKELMRQFISGLNEDDTFNIIDFANSTSKLADEPLANTRENRAQALAYVSKLDANGGTELMNGINTVLNFPAAADGRLRSIVLLSDGLIGNDEEVIRQIREKLQPGNRLYSFGVGHSTNRFLLNRLAELGRGTVTILPPKEDAVEVADKFFREINNPVVTNIEVKWIGEGKAPEIYPQQSPDLFASQPLILYGRKQDSKNGKLKIIGTVAGGQSYEKVLDVNFQQVSGNSAIAQLWGRSRIKDLMNQMYGRENPQGVSAVTQTALDYNLLSKYTAFVAVDDSKENNNLLSQTPRSNNVSAPEPRDIIGNLLALIFILLFFTRKRWNHLAKSMLQKLEAKYL
ncbi:MAG: VIT domain-containing protein [Xenococcaceae cyanobacterium MO_207.B15]|nr:VIT domain-containing protein [Xenococcaceae cyanobacterium MO_207.B15]